jgi:hypothetical protein
MVMSANLRLLGKWLWGRKIKSPQPDLLLERLSGRTALGGSLLRLTGLRPVEMPVD